MDVHHIADEVIDTDEVAVTNLVPFVDEAETVDVEVTATALTEPFVHTGGEFLRTEYVKHVVY